MSARCRAVDRDEVMCLVWTLRDTKSLHELMWSLPHAACALCSWALRTPAGGLVGISKGAEWVDSDSDWATLAE
jgi:hypothetical protein